MRILTCLVIVDGLWAWFGRSKSDEDIGVSFSKHSLLLELLCLVDLQMEDPCRECPQGIRGLKRRWSGPQRRPSQVNRLQRNPRGAENYHKWLSPSSSWVPLSQMSPVLDHLDREPPPWLLAAGPPGPDPLGDHGGAPLLRWPVNDGLEASQRRLLPLLLLIIRWRGGGGGWKWVLFAKHFLQHCDSLGCWSLLGAWLQGLCINSRNMSEFVIRI